MKNKQCLKVSNFIPWPCQIFWATDQNFFHTSLAPRKSTKKALNLTQVQACRYLIFCCLEYLFWINVGVTIYLIKVCLNQSSENFSKYFGKLKTGYKSSFHASWETYLELTIDVWKGFSYTSVLLWYLENPFEIPQYRSSCPGYVL